MSGTCELCVQRPALYCLADEARLCWTCDADVHGANFLVARHIRSLLCQDCGAETDCLTSGSHPTPLVRTCGTCNPAYVQEFPAHNVTVPKVSETKVVRKAVTGQTDCPMPGKRSREETLLTQNFGTDARLTAPKHICLEKVLGQPKDCHREAGVTCGVNRNGSAGRVRGVLTMKERSKRVRSPVSVMSLSISSGGTTDCDNATEKSDLTEFTDESSPPVTAGCLKLFG